MYMMYDVYVYDWMAYLLDEYLPNWKKGNSLIWIDTHFLFL